MKPVSFIVMFLLLSSATFALSVSHPVLNGTMNITNANGDVIAQIGTSTGYGIYSTYPFLSTKLIKSGGNLSADGNLIVGGTATVGGKKVCLEDGTNCGVSASYWLASGNNIYTSNSGNIGIGTTTPASKLSVGGTGNSAYSIFATGKAYGLYASGTSYGVYADGSNHKFCVSGSCISTKFEYGNFGVDTYSDWTGCYYYANIPKGEVACEKTGIYGFDKDTAYTCPVSSTSATFCDDGFKCANGLYKFRYVTCYKEKRLLWKEGNVIIE